MNFFEQQQEYISQLCAVAEGLEIIPDETLLESTRQMMMTVSLPRESTRVWQAPPPPPVPRRPQRAETNLNLNSNPMSRPQATLSHQQHMVQNKLQTLAKTMLEAQNSLQQLKNWPMSDDAWHLMEKWERTCNKFSIITQQVNSIFTTPVSDDEESSEEEGEPEPERKFYEPAEPMQLPPTPPRQTEPRRNFHQVRRTTSTNTSTRTTTTTTTVHNDNADSAKCCICHDSINYSDKVTNGGPCMTPCIHHYHFLCIGNWFATGQRSCPMCRASCNPSQIIMTGV